MEKDNEIIEICKKIDLNFNNIKEDVELTDEAKEKLTKEEINKLEEFIRTQKLLLLIEKKKKELENNIE